MIPSVPTERVARRIATLRTVYLPSPATALHGLPETTDPRLLARALQGMELRDDVDGALALLEGFSLRWPPARPLPFELAEAIVDLVASPRAALRSRVARMPEALLAWFDPHLDEQGSCWSQLRPALLEALGTTRARAWSSGMNGRAAELQRRLAQRRSDSLVARMEQLAELDRIMSSLVSTLDPRTVRERVAVWGGIPLDRLSLETIVLSHVVALQKLDPMAPEADEAAIALLTNLHQWTHEQLPALRRAWAAEAMAGRGRGTPGTGHAPETEDDAALAESRVVLSDAVRAAGMERPATLPDALHVERALNEGGRILACWSVARWRHHPRVLIALLGALSGLRGVRLRALPLVDLGLAPDQGTAVQLGTVAFADSFLSGMTIGEVWQSAPPIVARSGPDQRLDLLQEEHRQVIEADAALRSRLAGVAWDATRAPAVRHAALLAVLRSTPGEGERLELLERASRGDEPLLLAILAWVATHRVADVYPLLARMAPQVQARPDSLREPWLDALAATGDRRVAPLLEDDLLAGAADAEAVLARMGAAQRLDGFRARRAIGQRLGLQAEEDACRRRASTGLLEERGAALVVGIEQDEAVVDAALAATEAHAGRARYEIDATVTRLALVPLLAEVRRLLEEVIPPARDEAARRMALHEESRRELAVEVEHVEAIGRSVTELARKERRLVEEAGDAAARQRKLEAKQEAAARKVSAASNAERQAQEQLRRCEREASPETQATLTQARRAVSTAGSALDDARRDHVQLTSQAQQAAAEEAQLRRQAQAARVQANRLEGEILVAREAVQTAREAERRRHGNAQEAVTEVQDHIRRLESLRRQVDRLEAQARNLSHAHRDALRQRRAQVEQERARGRELATRLERHRQAGLRLEQQAVRAADRIIELDQRNATDLQVLQDKRPVVDAEAGRLEVRAVAAQEESRQRRRAHQELALDVDLLLNMLLRLQGEPTEEARRTGRRIGVRWDAPDLGQEVGP